MATTVMASSMSSLAFAAAAGRARVGRLSPVAHALAPRRRALVVRAQTQQPDVEPPTEETTTSSSTPSPSQAAPATTPNMATKKTASSPPPDLWDALAFNGPAPERINGRLAMLGFVSALAVEASRGGGLLAQAGSGSGFAAFAVAAAVLSVASLVPLLRGDSVEARGAGRVMNADAELWNGRFAMLGIVALGFTEYLTGAPFINV